MAPVTLRPWRSRASLDRNGRIGTEIFAIEGRVFARGPEIAERGIDGIAQIGIALANADPKRLDAEHVADDLEFRIVLLESLQDVEAAGQRIDAALSQREPRAVIVLESRHLGVRRGRRDVLLERRALLDGDLLAVEILEAGDLALGRHQERLAAGVIGDGEVDRLLSLGRIRHRGGDKVDIAAGQKRYPGRRGDLDELDTDAELL